MTQWFDRRVSAWAMARVGVVAVVVVSLALLASGCGDAEITGRPAPGGRAMTLHEAIRAGDVSEVKVLLTSGPEPLNLKGKDGPVVLAQAIEAEQPDVVKMLIAQGASAEGRDEKGRPLLFNAATTSGRMVRTLLASGVPVEMRDNVGQTALHVAVGESKLDSVEALLEGGIDVNAVDRSGLTALHTGINADIAVLDMLLARGAKVDTTDVRGSTPLHKAAAAGNTKAITWLLTHGAQVNRKNTNGHTPLYLARAEVRDLLKKHGAKE